MRSIRCVLPAALLAAAITIPIAADDDVGARATVEKAVRAHGSEALLTKFRGLSTKMKGNYHGMGQAIPYTGEVTVQGPDRQRIEIVAEAGGQQFRMIKVLDRDKGWDRVGDATKERDANDLAEAREQAYTGWVTTLVPLKDKAFVLATIGEVRVGDRAAVGVKVSKQGRRDVDLYFDKESGLLIKSESRVKDERTGQEVAEETFLSEYKDVQGIKQAMKFVVHRDGKLYVDGESFDVVLVEDLGDVPFARP